MRRHSVKATGRQGLPAEAILRCALLGQYRQLNCQELAFHWRTPPRRAAAMVMNEWHVVVGEKVPAGENL